tara:strand:- start:762 stop:950 length:189 start_codon:yes stop_codon:yes gene_type:complete
MGSHDNAHKTLTTSDDKDVAEAAKDSSKRPADSEADGRGGLNLGLILAVVALLLALLYFMFM